MLKAKVFSLRRMISQDLYSDFYLPATSFSVNERRHTYMSARWIGAIDLNAVNKRTAAAESRHSLCTWRGRYAGSCAADPGASQNDLSVGKREKKEQRGCIHILALVQTVGKRHAQAGCVCLTVSECLSQPECMCDPALWRLTGMTEKKKETQFF